MIIASLLLSSTFWYGRTKYFPDELQGIKKPLQGSKWLSLGGGILFAVLAAALCVMKWGWLTGIWMWILALMGVLSLLVILLPTHHRFLFLLGGLALIPLFLDLFSN